MSRQEELNRLINNIASDLEGFMGASVVDVETGMSLASVSRINDFDLDVASAYNSEMVKAKLKTIRALNLQVNLVDMLLTLEISSTLYASLTLSCSSMWLSVAITATWPSCAPPLRVALLNWDRVGS